MALNTALLILTVLPLILIGVLEILRRIMIENIRAKFHDTYMSYYIRRIHTICGNDSECREFLLNKLTDSLVRNIEENRIRYFDIDSFYKEYVSSKEHH